jgi:hypothetical protein
MRALSLLIVFLAPAFGAGQTASTAAPGQVTQPAPADAVQTQAPVFTGKAQPLLPRPEAAVAPKVVIVPGGANLASNHGVCLAMRVYQFSPDNPKKLTGYTECSKADVGAVRNVQAVVVR